MLGGGRRRWAVLLAVVALSACRGGEAAPDTTVSPDLEPAEVVSELLAAVAEGRFEDAAALTDQQQAGLLALAEGAEVNEVVEGLNEDAAGVAANFWSGFAQSLDPAFDPQSVTVQSGEPVEQDGRRYTPVTVVDQTGEERTYYLRADDGWKVDLMATFGPQVAERLTPRVEALLTSANPNAATVVSLLNQATPSLRVATSQQNLEGTTHQSVLALIERITRAG